MSGEIQYNQLPPGTIRNDSIIPFQTSTTDIPPNVARQGLGSQLSTLTAGLSVVFVSSPSNFPPPVGGFIRPANMTQYKVIAPFTLTTPILGDAGIESIITSDFPAANVINVALTPGTTLFQTLNLAGLVSSFADSDVEPGVKIKVTAILHGLTNDDKVNISGVLTETAYNGLGLDVSNAEIDPNEFDIPGVFTNTDTGDYDTGVVSFGSKVILFDQTGFPGTLKAFDMSWAFDTGFASASFELTGALINFADCGIVSPDTAAIDGAALSLVNAGLVINNASLTRISGVAMFSSNPGGTGTAITIQGTGTGRVTISDFVPDLVSVNEFPIRIAGDIPSTAEIKITNSGGSGIPTDYFDTSAGGLDQTDPRVITFSNGERADSMSKAQIGFTNAATPITVTIVTQDVPVLIGGTQFISADLERATASTGGQLTNLTRKPQDYPITFSALIEKSGGGATDIGLLLIKNGSLVLTDTFEIPHSLNAGIIQISATRDFNLADGDTMDMAVVNFSGVSDILVHQANMVYATKS